LPLTLLFSVRVAAGTADSTLGDEGGIGGLGADFFSDAQPALLFFSRHG